MENVFGSPHTTADCVVTEVLWFRYTTNTIGLPSVQVFLDFYSLEYIVSMFQNQFQLSKSISKIKK